MPGWTGMATHRPPRQVSGLASDTGDTHRLPDLTVKGSQLFVRSVGRFLPSVDNESISQDRRSCLAERVSLDLFTLTVYLPPQEEP